MRLSRIRRETKTSSERDLLLLHSFLFLRLSLSTPLSVYLGCIKEKFFGELTGTEKEKKQRKRKEGEDWKTVS